MMLLEKLLVLPGGVEPGSTGSCNPDTWSRTLHSVGIIEHGDKNDAACIKAIKFPSPRKMLQNTRRSQCFFLTLCRRNVNRRP